MVPRKYLNFTNIGKYLDSTVKTFSNPVSPVAIRKQREGWRFYGNMGPGNKLRAAGHFYPFGFEPGAIFQQKISPPPLSENSKYFLRSFLYTEKNVVVLG